MKNIVIGAAGFVGYYLIKELQSKKEDVYATKLPFEDLDSELSVKTYDLDICNIADIKNVLKEVMPDTIFHLAAQSSVSSSWKKPQLTANINIIGTINILESVKEICPQARVLLIGSSEEYGPINTNEKIIETYPLNPKNIYALSKATCESLGKIYSDAYNLNIISTRSFNHIGPRQLPQFVVPDFCNQVAKIEKGEQEPVLKVGNLSAYRDFTDVRDIVNAYYIISKKGQKNEVYNVGSGKAIQISKILDIILSNSSIQIKVEIDHNKFRPIDVPKIEANPTKLCSLGWAPKYNINNSIKDILNYFRNL